MLWSITFVSLPAHLTGSLYQVIWYGCFVKLLQGFRLTLMSIYFWTPWQTLRLFIDFCVNPPAAILDIMTFDIFIEAETWCRFSAPIRARVGGWPYRFVTLCCWPCTLQNTAPLQSVKPDGWDKWTRHRLAVMWLRKSADLQNPGKTSIR